MKFKIITNFDNDPSFVIETDDDFNPIRGNPWLQDVVMEELCNDYGIPFDVGFILTIERVK